jgi:hypothetical protein
MVARPVAAADLPAPLEPYLERLESRAVGGIDGRAHGLPRRATSAPEPFAGVSVVLVPFDGQVEASLDRIKASFRDSMAAYTAADAEVTAVRERYERDLRTAGGEALIFRAVSDGSGSFAVSGVPAGDWLLLAWREERHAVKGPRTPGRDAGRFQGIHVVTGHVAVSHWRVRVSVRAGETTAVTLSDRAVWLTAVRVEVAGSPPTGAAPHR